MENHFYLIPIPSRASCPMLPSSFFPVHPLSPILSSSVLSHSTEPPATAGRSLPRLPIWRPCTQVAWVSHAILLSPSLVPSFVLYPNAEPQPSPSGHTMDRHRSGRHPELPPLVVEPSWLPPPATSTHNNSQSYPPTFPDLFQL